MRYEKPELTLVATNASMVIQNHIKGPSDFLDVLLEQTMGAYQADE